MLTETSKIHTKRNIYKIQNLTTFDNSKKNAKKIKKKIVSAPMEELTIKISISAILTKTIYQLKNKRCIGLP